MGNERHFKLLAGELTEEWVLAEFAEFLDDRDLPASGLVFAPDVFRSQQDAKQWMASQSGTGFAARFRDTGNALRTPKLESLEKKREKLRNRYRICSERLRRQSLPGAYLTCPSCGSSLSLEYLQGVLCPLCDADLRNAPLPVQMEMDREELEKVEREIEEEKASAPVPLRWLILYRPQD